MHLLNWLGDTATRLIFTSSTSVYPQTDGNWVDETANHDGATGTAINLLKAEALFQESPQLEANGRPLASSWGLS